MSNEIEEIYQSVEKGMNLVVATIISSSSTPRSSGTKMIVYENGKIFGTIGGGAVETDVIQSALRLFKTIGAKIVTYGPSLTDNTDQKNLICGGEMRVLIEYVSASKDNIRLYGKACKNIKDGQSFLWIAKLIKEDGHWQVEREMQKVPAADFKATVREVDGQLNIIEPIIPDGTVYVIGAGHVSTEIVALTKQIGLMTVVIDDREEFANEIRFPDLDRVYTCPEYADVFKPFSINSNSYIIIVTRSHHFDKEVLAQALQTEASYIGMIGSLRKRDTIYKELIDRGFEQSTLEKVFCPIGLPINAETPAQIGVSIVAQIIQHCGNRKKHG